VSIARPVQRQSGGGSSDNALGSYHTEADVVVTGWSEGRIPWPRCRRLGRNGGNGLLVDEELARAVRSESKRAIRY
jgi:hypothetical protein